MGDKPYQIEFVWETTGNQGKIQVARCNDQSIPGESGWGGGIANQYVQLATSEQQNACLAVNKSQVVQQTTGRFVYLDVGGWVAGKQSFGVIWGNTAVLCSYSPSSASPAPGTGNLLQEFLKLPGVSETKRLWIDGPNTGDWNMVQVVLPDTHVPVSPPPGFSRPPEDPKKWNDLTMGAWSDDPRVYDKFAKRDLFNSRASIGPMTQFLNLLATVKFAKQIQLVQLGDMYELWAARELLYVPKPGGPPGVALKTPAAAATVGGWIADTHEFFPDLFRAYDACVAGLKWCKFIHGNHDSYLSVPEVIAEGNKQIDALVARPNGWLMARKMVKTTVHPRDASGNVFDRGIFIEHGQRCDGNNNDGNPSGHEKTQSAVEHPSLGGFDSTRRPSFVTGAAAIWLLRGRDFGCYVMGHTHSPDLNYVEVTHKIIKPVSVKVGPQGFGPMEPKI